MNWVDQVIAEFGRNIGISSLALDSRQRLSLGLASGKTLTIAHLSELPIPEVIISMSSPSNYSPTRVLIDMLQRPHFESTPGWTLQTGITEDSLFFTLRIPERAFRLNTLENSIDAVERFLM
jgi:hypothetical protein